MNREKEEKYSVDSLVEEDPQFAEIYIRYLKEVGKGAKLYGVELTKEEWYRVFEKAIKEKKYFGDFIPKQHYKKGILY